MQSNTISLSEAKNFTCYLINKINITTRKHRTINNRSLVENGNTEISGTIVSNKN